MTNKERLEEELDEICSNVSPLVDTSGEYNGIRISQKHFDWLIEQAERVQELKEQNIRYREALEWYSDNSPKGNVADEVLEDER